MNIYLITQEKFSSSSSEYFDSHVVVADTITEVVLFAKSMAIDEGQSVWEDAIVSLQGVYTGQMEVPFVLLSSYNGC